MPTALNRFVDYRTVQEQSLKLGSWAASTGMGVLPYRAHSAGPGQFRFTAFSRMAPGGSAPYDFYLSGSWNYSTLDVRDCSFLNGGGVIQDASDVTVALENNLFERTVFFAADSMVLDLHNNFFRGGSVQLDSWGDTVWVIKDNAFDNCSVSADWITPYDHGHNAYINAGRIDAPVTNDVVTTNFAYVAGPLGKYYQLSTNLINAGSRTADLAGLYHWTTQTNQVKETNSMVDIGFHYVAVDTNGLAIDSDGGGVADSLEDSSGDGTVNGDESDWTSGVNHGSDDFKHLLTPEYLRVEYRENPWGITTNYGPPRFFWIVSSGRRAEKQIAYQIQVATSTNYLGSEIVWDSKRVKSDQTIHVEYNGNPLQTGQRLYWRVRTWDLFTGISKWSTNGFFQVGLLSTNDWDGAKWIGPTNYTAGSSPAPMYRKVVLQRTNQIKRATAYVSAKGAYELWINGQRIGQNILAPEWTEFRKRIQYQTFDVTTNLLSGGPEGSINVLGAVVGEGWFSADFKKAGYPDHETPQAQFLLKVNIEYDGTNDFIATDNTWRYSASGPIQRASIWDGETYDATKEAPLNNWTSPIYTNAGTNFTLSVSTNGVDASKMAAQPTEPIRIMEYLHPVDMWTIQEGNKFYRIYDLGQNIAGWCILSLTNNTTNQTSGLVVKLKHGEALEVNPSNNTQTRGSNVYFLTLGGNANGQAEQLETYTLNSSGQQQLQPHFTYHGFRYVRVESEEWLPLDIHSVVGCVIRSALPETGAFSCSHRDVNQLMTNTAWTLKGNLYGIETDCTQRRERYGWLGDSDAFSQTACFMMDMSAFYTRGIRDIRDDQDDSTYAGNYQPNNPFNGLAVADLGWSTGGLIKPWQLYQNYADWRILQEHYVSAKSWVTFLQNKFPGNLYYKVAPWGTPNADWLHCGTIYWQQSPSWPAGNAAMDVDGLVHSQCYFAYSVDLMANFADVLRAQALLRNEASTAAAYASDYTTYTNLAANVRSAFRSSSTVTYSSGNITQIGSGSQANYAYALYFNMVPENQRWNCMYLMTNTAGAGILNYNGSYVDPATTNADTKHLSTGIQGTVKAMLELTRNGASTLAYELLTDYRFPSWFFQITNSGAIYTGPAEAYGATTGWERWNGIVSRVPGNYASGINSMNHFWAGAVGQWLYQNIGGINLEDASPGFQNVTIWPRLWGGISNAVASLKSIHGLISNSWSWTNSATTTNFFMTLVIPANTTASVYVPSTNLTTISESGATATNSPGVIYYEVRPTNRATLFRLGSGTYNFSATGIAF